MTAEVNFILAFISSIQLHTWVAFFFVGYSLLMIHVRNALRQDKDSALYVEPIEEDEMHTRDDGEGIYSGNIALDGLYAACERLPSNMEDAYYSPLSLSAIAVQSLRHN